MVSKKLLLQEAAAIVKEYARGGGTEPLDAVLEAVYKKLNELNEDLSEE